MDDAPRILGGRYEVGELIGRGGMAEVHIGHDTRLGRTVAIKILRSDLARDPSFQARFRREAQAAAALNHPAIVAVYDTGEDVYTDPTGGVHHVPFIVMEYVEGHTVRDILRDGSAVPIEEAVEITVGVLSALEYSHHAGIVHRDIKPANVMLTPTGAVKVMDFGIARAMADSAGTMTQTQAVIGTAQYLSPEQARGEAVDTRSDLYSTGCLLFELLTGRPPFIGDSPVAVAYQHAREEAPAPSTFASDVPDPLDRITVKSLAKDRDDRYSTAAEFRAELESALRGGHVGAPPVGVLGAAAAGAAGAAATQVLRPGGDGATQVMGAAPGAGQTQVMGAAPGAGQTQVMGAAGPSWGQVQTGQQPVVPPAEGDDEPPKRRGLIWALVVVAVLAAVGIIALLLMNGEEPTVQEVEVPDVVSMSEAAAREAIEAEGLRFDPVTAPDATVEAGFVVSTDPPAGTMLERGDPVKVTISAGPNSITVPDLENLTQDQARQRLQDAGHTGPVSTASADHPSIERDRVIGTDPAAQAEIAADAPIVLRVSTGPVQLPELTGRTQEEAVAQLDELGLNVRLTEEESDEEPGRVLRQSRPAGPVPQGTTIDLVIAAQRQAEEVTVPELFNLTEQRAQEALGQNGLNVGPRREEASNDVAAGRVIRSEPGAGTTLTEGTEVTLVVSTGPANNGGGNGGDNGGGDGGGDGEGD